MADHFREAEQLLDRAYTASIDDGYAAYLVASAQVHATLALAAGTVDVLAERDDQIARVRELHQPHPDGSSMGYVEYGTGPNGGDYGEIPVACKTCGSYGEYGVPWPCPTAQALGAGAES